MGLPGYPGTKGDKGRRGKKGEEVGRQGVVKECLDMSEERRLTKHLDMGKIIWAFVKKKIENNFENNAEKELVSSSIR